MVNTNDKVYCVYAHINKVNGKIYIGQTCQDINRRWRDGDGYKGCTLFYKAIQKYGWDNFDHEIIASNLTLQEANHFEELLISKLDTMNPNKGYNLRSGGENYLVSEEARIHMKQSRPDVNGEKNPFYGKHHTNETKQKLSKRRIGKYKGKDNYFYGKRHTEDTKKKLSESRKNKKPILCVETNILYPSMREAQRMTNISRQNIKSSLKTNGTAGGYHWRYADDINSNDVAV